jgi:catechol 2,3-dioxygenase-like lactoylglutathione lyase family enzyme
MLPSLNHVGLTVHSIEDTIAFYKQLTSVEVFEETVHITGDGVGEVIRVKSPDYKSCMVRIGNRAFELIEHLGSKGRHLVANHNDVCGIHLAFMVHDIDDVFGRVKALGYQPTTERPFTATNLGGYQAFFFRDLNGVQIEVGQVN